MKHCRAKTGFNVVGGEVFKSFQQTINTNGSSCQADTGKLTNNTLQLPAGAEKKSQSGKSPW